MELGSLPSKASRLDTQAGIVRYPLAVVGKVFPKQCVALVLLPVKSLEISH